MRALRILMLVLMAAVFTVGGPLRAMPAHADGVPPCHEMAAEAVMDMAGHVTDKAPAHKTKHDAVAINCCAGCMPAAARDVAPDLTPGLAAPVAFAPLNQIVSGLALAPEHGPPRTFA